MNTEDKICEWCPYCDAEVELPVKLGIYICPSCGKHIINCSECTIMRCGICELYEEVKIANGEI